MTTKTVNSSFSIENKASANHHRSIGCRLAIKPLTWFAKMVRNETFDKESINQALSELMSFIEQREFDKEDAIAELQLAYAYQNSLEEKRVELTKSTNCER
jgi:hypothetical protein